MARNMLNICLLIYLPAAVVVAVGTALLLLLHGCKANNIIDKNITLELTFSWRWRRGRWHGSGCGCGCGCGVRYGCRYGVGVGVGMV